MSINQTIGVYNNWYYSDTQVSWQITRLGIISCWVDHAMVSTLLKYEHYFAKDGYWEGKAKETLHSLAHTAEKGNRKQSGFTSFFWQHLNMSVQSPGQRDTCLWIHPEHTHCSSTSRCQSFQKEIQNLYLLAMIWKWRGNSQKGKTHKRRQLHQTVHSSEACNIFFLKFPCRPTAILATQIAIWVCRGHTEHGTQNRGATQPCPPIHHR